MKAKEWLEVITQAENYNPKLTPLIEKYGQLLLEETDPDTAWKEKAKKEIERVSGLMEQKNNEINNLKGTISAMHTQIEKLLKLE